MTTTAPSNPTTHVSTTAVLANVRGAIAAGMRQREAAKATAAELAAARAIPESTVAATPGTKA